MAAKPIPAGSEKPRNLRIAYVSHLIHTAEGAQIPDTITDAQTGTASLVLGLLEALLC